jgi:hypothetical protein
MGPMVDVAKGYAPVKTGTLRAAIHLTVGF